MSPTSKKKVLILTAGFGEGHNTAARSLEAAFGQIAGDVVDAKVVDLFHECYGLFNGIARKAYLGVINSAPRIWQQIYGWLDNSTALESNIGLLAIAAARLSEMLEREKPDAVVSTYPVYNYLISRIYPEGKRRPFSQMTIITDSITINSVWYRAGSDYFIVPNEDTAMVLRGKNVPEEKIQVLGFPVTPRFSTEAINRPPPVNGNRRILYMINSGKDQAPETVRRVLEVSDIQLTVTVGRDEVLRAAIEKVVAASGKQVEIHGWTRELPNLLMSHHLLLGKAGGATVQETIAAKTPMIIMQVVPGQEEGNARLLLDRECGALAETAEEIVKTIRMTFQNGTQTWTKWEENISKLSRPDAALVIARFVLGQMGK